MSATEYLPDDLLRFFRFVGNEIRSFPGRSNVMLRCVLTSAIVVTASMTLQVPLLALSLIVVFYVTQANVVLTRLIGVLFMVGSTLAVASAILVLKLTYDYPLLRILLSAALFFFSVYMMRVAKIGVVFFIVGLVVIYVQSFVDMTDQAEVLVRLVLWVWVAVNYPIALTLVINTLFLPAEPVQHLENAMLGQLKVVDASLASLEQGSPSASGPGARAIQTGMLTLQKLLRFATMRDATFRQREAFHLARVTTVSRLYAAAGHLPEMAAEIPAAVVPALRHACDRLVQAIRAGEPFVLPTDLADLTGQGMPGALREMRDALHAFATRSEGPETTESAREKERLLVPDAFSNPVYAQFALKTLFAALCSYVFYRATDWQGIHTIMLTCLIVAQPSLGATAQRSVLRIGGALLGSALALAMVVWVVPGIDGIVGLLLMALPVLALSAWVAAGSERISYAGTQIMFTFALALLEQFGPTTDLTEIRDRMIGILLGVAISAAVHALVWPEAEGEALRQRIARLLRGLAGQFRQADAAAALPAALWAQLGDCEAMAARVALEPGWQIGEGQQEGFTIHVQTLLAQTREILLAAQAFDAERRAQAVTEPITQAVTRLRETVSASLDGYACDLAEHPEAVRSPAPVLPDRFALAVADLVEPRAETARVAYQRLLRSAQDLIEQISTLPAWGVGPADTVLKNRASQA